MLMHTPERQLIPINWQSADLPTMPTIARRLIEMLCEVEKETEELCELISQDPALTAKLLQIANSALYSLSSEVTSIKHAVVLLGQDEVIQLAVSTLLAKRFLTVPKELKGHAERLWKHCLATAYIAKDFGSDIEEPDLYTLGILHDIGWLIMMSQAPSLFLTMIQERPKSLKSLEEDWGIDHQYWGAKLLEKWDLPEPFQVTALRHHHPEIELSPPKYLLILTLSNFLANHMKNNLWSFEEDEIPQNVLSGLDLDQDAFNEMIEWANSKKDDVELQYQLTRA